MCKQPGYTEDFKLRIVELHENGKSINNISKEYGVAKQSVSNWYNQYKTSASFKAADNLSNDEKE